MNGIIILIIMLVGVVVPFCLSAFVLSVLLVFAHEAAEGGALTRASGPGVVNLAFCERRQAERQGVL